LAAANPPVSHPSALRQRIISALVIAPPALAAVWFGSPWLSALILLAVAVMGWEWARLCGLGWLSPAGALIILTGMAAVLLVAVGRPEIASLVAVVGSVVVLGVVGVGRSDVAPWAGIGTLWIALPCVAFLWIGTDPRHGRATLLWLLALIWASDIAAYFVGRRLGGPKLAPRLSPNKTWSGAIGGLVGAALVGLIVAWLSGAPASLLVPVSLLLGVAAQIGDLLESLAKRHFGVKDSSNLIPGHGGVLDRLDSALTAAAMQALITLASGASPLTWRA
jgi:phosphatidate cytidylyltransferase